MTYQGLKEFQRVIIAIIGKNSQKTCSRFKTQRFKGNQEANKNHEVEFIKKKYLKVELNGVRNQKHILTNENIREKPH